MPVLINGTSGIQLPLGSAGSSSGGKTTASVTATNGDFNGISQVGMSSDVSGRGTFGLGGTASPFGSGGYAVIQTGASTSGANASGYGSGGSCGMAGTSGTYTNTSGGNGTQSLIRIWEYT